MKKSTYLDAALICLIIFGVFSQMAYALRVTMYPWTMFRHDLSRSGTTESTAPNSNDTAVWSWSSYYPDAIVLNGRVIATTSSQLYALDETTGVPLWGPVSFTGSFYGAPMAVGDRLYIGTTSGYMYCVNATNGAKIWEYQVESPGQIQTVPAVANGRVYFGTSNNYLYAIDEMTGLYRWRYTAADSIWYSSPAVDGTWIYFGCDDGKLYALNDTGSLPQKKWDYPTGGRIYCTPLIAEGKILFGSSGLHHAVFTLNKTTGQLIWKFAVTGGYNLDNPLAFSNGFVFLTASNQKAYALYSTAIPGNYTEGDPVIQLWSQTVGSSLREPTVADGKVFMCAGSKLYALNADTGQTIWHYTFSSTAYTPIVADDRLFVTHYYGITCFGEPFPPETYHYIVNAGGSDWDIFLVINATPGTLDASGLVTLRKISYELEGISGTKGFSNMTIPRAMLERPYTVTVDGGLPNTVSETYNSTHSVLHFTYDHSVHAVEIEGTYAVPEFSPVALLTLLMSATIVAILGTKYVNRNRRLS